LKNLIIKRIKEETIIDAENNLKNQIELVFQNHEKTAQIILEGKGSIKVFAAV
jgi:hypothetical protein